MKSIRKISGILLAAMVASSLLAQNTDCYFNKNFPVIKGSSINVSNKYGDINIFTVKEDSLSVCAVIRIEQEDRELGQKSIKLIGINIDKLKDNISISTTYDSKFFSQTYRQGRKNFSVDYIIKLPTYLDITITNTFGNVSIEELSGKVDIKLSRGIFSAKNLSRGNTSPINSINIDHGKVSIDELNWMSVTANNCNLIAIGEAQALMMNSDFSKIKIGRISSLVSDSRSDSYAIGSIINLVSQSNYTTFEIEKLSGQLKSKATYGSINVSDVNKEFRSIDIVAKQTQISLKPGADASFRADVVATDALVDFPAEKYPGIIKTKNIYSTTLVGITGIDKDSKSLIRLQTSSGKISIY